LQHLQASRLNVFRTHFGLVYNFHHAHHQIHNFPALVEMMLPWLWTVNLNGLKQILGEMGDAGALSTYH
jgi:hypothetical protein